MVLCLFHRVPSSLAIFLLAFQFQTAVTIPNSHKTLLNVSNKSHTLRAANFQKHYSIWALRCMKNPLSIFLNALWGHVHVKYAGDRRPAVISKQSSCLSIKPLLNMSFGDICSIHTTSNVREDKVSDNILSICKETYLVTRTDSNLPLCTV